LTGTTGTDENKDPKAFVLKGATTGGIPGVKPPRPEDLPPEEQFQVTSNSNADLYGEFTDEDRQVARQRMEEVTSSPTSTVFDQDDNALDWFQKKTVEGFRYWAGFTQYKIKFDDGSKVIYERQPLTKYQSDELLDLSAEIQGMREIDSDKILSVTEVRKRQKTLDKLKAAYYMKNVKTGKMMTSEELSHVADSTIIDSILEACLAITVAKWAEGKK
jgi:hypothetical protein